MIMVVSKQTREVPPCEYRAKKRRRRMSNRATISNKTLPSMQIINMPKNISILSFGLIFIALISLAEHISLTHAQSISIRPTDFDRLIMPCYLSGSALSGQSYYQTSALAAVPVQSQSSASWTSSYPSSGVGQAYGSQTIGRQSGASTGVFSGQQAPGYYASPEGSGGMNGNRLSSNPPPYPAAPPAFGPLPGRASGDSLTSGSSSGQSMPRANTVDNFIALVSKIESANPRLAQNVDELIRALLSRFRMDNYYYDSRSRTPISSETSDRRNTDILPAILAPAGNTQQTGQGYDAFASQQGAYSLTDQSLNHDERCSMYFMLSHFIDKTSSMQTLSQLPVPQLSGPLQGQRSPNLQAQAASNAGALPASSNYPAQSAQLSYSGGSSGPRFSGPSPSFGSPATSQMNHFGSGISNSQPEFAGKNAYGVNSPLPSGPFGQSAYNNPLSASARLNPGQFGGTNLASNRATLGQPPYIDGQSRARSPEDKIATEYGVVTLAGQDNAALVLNRVLMGILAAATPPQTIRQLATQVYPNQLSLNLNTPKADEELDPLFAVTLADLWAVSSIPKAGKPFDFRLLGDNGHWNDSFCPTTFTLERASSIKFTTAELLGGLDGFNLGFLRRRLMNMRRNVKLSEMLKIYYSPTGFRPQFPEVGVCNRYAALSTQSDDLHRQAENYARLMQLNLPTNDNEIAISINRLDAFRDITRQAASQYAPQSICQDSAGITTELYPMNGQESCEISRADVVAILDSSAQANGDPFMQSVVAKLAQRLGLAARGGSSLTVMTNQLDTTGTAGGSYSFNTILRNSTNLAEIGCALVHDSTRSYQGSQVTEPTRLIELFERALVNLDSEYLTRQGIGSAIGSGSSSSSSSGRPSTFVSTWYGNGVDTAGNYMLMNGGGPRSTGGAKVILWFNYANNALRPNSASSGPTNWTPGQTYMSSSASRQEENEYRFHEAKKLLRENFRGASILAISPNRDSVKAFVYDEERDIFTDIPSPSSPGSSDGTSNDYSPPSSYGLQTDVSMYSGQADQLLGKLVQRICTIPAIFQYPMCFHGPSDGAQSVGYITPGRKQYWMMAPKTFFASRSIRMAFRVEGGRLRVCFGRRPNPDETSLKNKDRQQQIYQQQQQSISFTNTGQQAGSQQSTQTPPKASDDDYYLGMEFGVCKDVSPGQEIDFLVSDACYKRSIAECEPFYFVVREISQPGEGDPNYMCRDDGCKRFDQAKFIMTHTGVVCSSALNRANSFSWLTIMISTLVTSYTLFGDGDVVNVRMPTSANIRHIASLSTRYVFLVMTSLAAIILFICAQQVDAQLQGGVYDFGQDRSGEKRGNFTPSEWLAIVLIVMLIVGGLAITFSLCYYVTKRARQGTRVPQDDY